MKRFGKAFLISSLTGFQAIQVTPYVSAIQLVLPFKSAEMGTSTESVLRKYQGTTQIVPGVRVRLGFHLDLHGFLHCLDAQHAMGSIHTVWTLGALFM